MNRSILRVFLACCLPACTAASAQPNPDTAQAKPDEAQPNQARPDEANPDADKTDAKTDTAASELSEALAAFEVASFQNVKSSRCVGVDGASTANGALLKQFSCEIAPNQNWRIVRNGIEHTMINVKSGKCMGVDGASTSPGANIGQYNCGDGAPNQSWVLIAVGGTTQNPIANFRNVKSGLCIGVDGASTANGAQLKQFACDNAVNQQWRLIER